MATTHTHTQNLSPAASTLQTQQTKCIATRTRRQSLKAWRGHKSDENVTHKFPFYVQFSIDGESFTLHKLHEEKRFQPCLPIVVVQTCHLKHVCQQPRCVYCRSLTGRAAKVRTAKNGLTVMTTRGTNKGSKDEDETKMNPKLQVQCQQCRQAAAVWLWRGHTSKGQETFFAVVGPKKLVASHCPPVHISYHYMYHNFTGFVPNRNDSS